MRRKVEGRVLLGPKARAESSQAERSPPLPAPAALSISSLPEAAMHTAVGFLPCKQTTADGLIHTHLCHSPAPLSKVRASPAWVAQPELQGQFCQSLGLPPPPRAQHTHKAQYRPAQRGLSEIRDTHSFHYYQY